MDSAYWTPGKPIDSPIHFWDDYLECQCIGGQSWCLFGGGGVTSIPRTWKPVSRWHGFPKWVSYKILIPSVASLQPFPVKAMHLTDSFSNLYENLNIERMRGTGFCYCWKSLLAQTIFSFVVHTKTLCVYTYMYMCVYCDHYHPLGAEAEGADLHCTGRKAEKLAKHISQIWNRKRTQVVHTVGKSELGEPLFRKKVSAADWLKANSFYVACTNCFHKMGGWQ